MWDIIRYNQASINPDVRIVKLGQGDEILNSIYRNDLKHLVEMLDDNYPGIDRWFTSKVVPGLKEKERFAYLVYFKDKPAGMAIVKKGKQSKLCSMRLNPEYQHLGFGNLLLSLIGREIRGVSDKLYFTAPESIYLNHKAFFDKYRFDFLGEAGSQYRLFDKEISCSINTDILWNSIIENIDKLISQFSIVNNPSYPDLVISIRPEFANKIKSGEKRVEIRKKFDKKWKGSYIMIYSTAPVSEYIGEAYISNIIEDTPDRIWQLFGSAIGADKTSYNEYCKGTESISALLLDNVTIYKKAIMKSRLEYLLKKELVSPQSHAVIKKDSIWPTAISLNYLLMA